MPSHHVNQRILKRTLHKLKTEPTLQYTKPEHVKPLWSVHGLTFLRIPDHTTYYNHIIWTNIKLSHSELPYDLLLTIWLKHLQIFCDTLTHSTLLPPFLIISVTTAHNTLVQCSHHKLQNNRQFPWSMVSMRLLTRYYFRYNFDPFAIR